MMDAHTTNQSHTPCQPWGAQNGWSLAPAQGPSCNPLPDFQQLSLGCSDQGSGYHYLVPGDITPVSSRKDAHHTTQHPDNTDQTSQTHFSSMVSTVSPGSSIPQYSLPFPDTGKQGYETHQMVFNSTQSLYQAIPSLPQFHSSHTYRSSPNGPQTTHESYKHLPLRPPASGQCINLNPMHSPHPAVERGNVKPSDAYMHTPDNPGLFR